MSQLRVAAAAVRTVAAYVFVSVYTLVVGPPALALAWLFGWHRQLYAAAAVAVRLALALVGIRYSVGGQAHIDPGRAAIYCVNHASNVEPPVLFHALRRLAPRLKILYKAELRSLPILVRGFDLVGFVPIQRGNRDQSTRAIDQAAGQARSGDSFLVFPEGTRSRTGDLLPFKKGAFVLAIKAQVPVVPMAIAGAERAMRKGSPFIWPAHVTIEVGPPVETRGLGPDDRDRLLDTVRERVAALLGRARSAVRR